MRKIVILLFAFMGVFLHPYGALGIKSSPIAGKISLGYDTLTIRQAESKITRSFSNTHLDSKLSLFPHSKRLDGVFRFQNGFKMISEDENILFNQGNLDVTLLISPKITSEILCEVKRKDISPVEDFSIQGEYGYRYWNSGLSLKFNGNDFHSSIRYLHHQRDYTDRDFFDSRANQIQLTTNAFFSRTLTGCLTGKVETCRLSRQSEDSLQEHTDQEHRDTLYELSLGSQWIDDFLINPGYAFQWNRSNHSEYSFHAHQLSILAAFPLFWEMTLQCYGHLQLCTYKSQNLPSLSPPDEDNMEQSHNVLVFSLSRDISKYYSLELRYLLSQTGVSSSSEKYKKQSGSLAVSYLF